jgi:hypothetical protein
MIIEGKGALLEFTNKSEQFLDANYASLTAPGSAKLEIFVNGVLHDAVHINSGSSHSWWTQAGGKFLPPNGIAPGESLKIVSSAEVALRIDWNEFEHWALLLGD